MTRSASPSSGKISPWTGRFYSLLDPSYAKNNIPIIASVSEHQPTTWSSYYFDLQLLVFMFPGTPSERPSCSDGLRERPRSGGGGRHKGLPGFLCATIPCGRK